uniref:Leucine-rich repeat-containing N-terminal plant-type domain-containing protein n=1 Tax=Lactuca sativa TaxID=4236 RepID=A0A9R1URV9_LACSA|nr:hypothetical protein LSAT_V11C800410440 [Lactuca sativa]
MRYLFFEGEGADTVAAHHTYVSDVTSSLAELRHLKYLDLSGNLFQRSQILYFIGSLKQLSYLNLSDAEFIGIIPPHIRNLSNLKVLERVNWDMVLHMIPSLKELSLRRCSLSNVNLGAFLNSSRVLPNIKHLDVGFNSTKKKKKKTVFVYTIIKIVTSDSQAWTNW